VPNGATAAGGAGRARPRCCCRRLAFGADAFEQYARGFVVGVLRDEFAGEGGAQDVLALGGGPFQSNLNRSMTRSRIVECDLEGINYPILFLPRRNANSRSLENLKIDVLLCCSGRFLFKSLLNAAHEILNEPDRDFVRPR
jgi:hypothetical protein